MPNFKRAWVATVQLLILADDANTVSDAISGALTESWNFGGGENFELTPDSQSYLLDWGYPMIGGQRLVPSPYDSDYVDVDNYKEGEFMNHA